MYDHPAARRATDRLWSVMSSELNARGIDAPGTLHRPSDYVAGWTDPNLLLSQTCGYPYVSMLRGKVRLVATPCYRAEGCEGPSYRSVLVTRADDPAETLQDLRGRRAAFNATHSQSGYNCLRAVIAPLSGGLAFFSGLVETGRHAASLEAVAANDADLCAVDCVTWALEVEYAPEAAARFKVIGWTDPAPALPYITSLNSGAPTLVALRAALNAVAEVPELEDVREALFLDGFKILTDQGYDAILEMERRAAASGYPKLA